MTRTFLVDVTVRSADRGWDYYADAFEVLSPDGTVLGRRELLHPHENEQPFRRELQGLKIPHSRSIRNAQNRNGR
jgi:hypothetical protein